MAVEPLAGDGVHNAHENGAGHEHEARHRSRQPMERLHVDGHEDAGRQQGPLHEHADDGADKEAAVLQHINPQHGVGQPRLADEEPHHPDDANHGSGHGHQGQPRRAQGRETIEHEPEAQGR